MASEPTGLKYGDLTQKIIGVFYDVYNELGNGFLESVYQRALFFALRDVGLEVEREVPIPVSFRGRTVGEFSADLIVNHAVVLELKTARALDSTHEAQVLHYLKSTSVEVALLLNFGPKPQVRRFILDNEQKRYRAPAEATKEVSV